VESPNEIISSYYFNYLSIKQSNKTRGKNKVVFYRQTIVSPTTAPKCFRPETHSSPKGFVCNTSEKMLWLREGEARFSKGVLGLSTLGGK